MDIKTLIPRTSPAQAVLVTEENYEEVAVWCGGRLTSEYSKVPMKGRDDLVIFVSKDSRERVAAPKEALFFIQRFQYSVKQDGSRLNFSAEASGEMHSATVGEYVVLSYTGHPVYTVMNQKELEENFIEVEAQS